MTSPRQLPIAAARPSQRLACALLAIASMAFATPASAAGPDAFAFIAMGDMPYRAADEQRVDRLIDSVNAARPDFVVHVGDFISGASRCSDENLEREAARLARIEAPLVYTPGDNEWTDCHRTLGGGFEPRERLAKVRALMFPAPGRSLGPRPIRVESQALTMADRFPAYVENVRFAWKGVLIATVHVVGSRNNRDPARPEAMAEHEARDAANVAWIDDAFAQAARSGAKGLVLAWQAQVHGNQWRRDPLASGFSATVDAVARGAASFGRPVLVVCGDGHVFEIVPFWGPDRRPAPGVTRVQVPGDRSIHAVRVTVDPASPEVFSISEFTVEGNGAP